MPENEKNQTKSDSLKFEHIDDFILNEFIASSRPELAYPHFMFNYWRLPSILKMAYYPFMKNFQLFVEYEGQVWRVTGASRMGDIYLTLDLDQDHGYGIRVLPDFNKFSNWSSEKPVKAGNRFDAETAARNGQAALERALDDTISRSSPES